MPSAWRSSWVTAKRPGNALIVIIIGTNCVGAAPSSVSANDRVKRSIVRHARRGIPDSNDPLQTRALAPAAS
jgi:hypothetical protein